MEGIADRETSIALVTSQIVEAWLARQPIAKSNVTAEQLSDVIMCVRIGLTAPLALDGTSESPKPGLRLVDKP